MSIFEQINEDIKKAMLAKEKEKLEALRAVKAAFLLAKTDGGNSELTYEKEVQILQKLIKQRKDAAEIYRTQNRPDLYETEEFQAQIISQYLPKQLSPEELKEEVQKIVTELGASSLKDMGRVMAEANKRLAGRTESKLIADAVKGILGA
ncbi:MAG: GatB/YqeY domain-containing protein [Bacteroidales bacterium]|jgi:uncharacterized protein YqeY|nr:GatB/YqeY domain-containing protein [Bacteroidales bacterium]HOL97735.1 GatB/YqeY domain-containing protein [Bacteroidales bacterium]HOM36312.1 GatB/YqeY domain-containing protein [Bacteroidales bacterium]HPD23596.1 GatB/YqeY domain-containing protein [Bacteroidales bacterium]HRS99491.1 GatB/YqeY domain-containing protein [Bacteroidales bacterium]